MSIPDYYVLPACLISAAVAAVLTWLRMRSKIKAAEQNGMRQMQALVRDGYIRDTRG